MKLSSNTTHSASDGRRRIGRISVANSAGLRPIYTSDRNGRHTKNVLARMNFCV